MDSFKGLMFFDYDGTLIDTFKHTAYPTLSTRRAIKRAQEMGYGAILATGRSLCYVPECGVDFDGYITSNGAYARIRRSEILSVTIEKELLKELAQECKRAGALLLLENQSHCYSNDIERPLMRAFLDKYNIPTDIFLPLDFDAPIYKCMIAFSKQQAAQAIQERFEGRLTVRVHRSSISADVDTLGMNKGVGVRAALDFTGLSRDDAYAFGDGSNDIELFESVGHAVASRIHYKPLEKLCEFVTSGVEDGIENALINLGII